MINNNELTIAQEYKDFESLIQFNLCDKNSKINRSEIVENDLGTWLLIYYTITDEYADQEQLCYKNRVMEILLKRSELNKGLPIASYADRK